MTGAVRRHQRLVRDVKGLSKMFTGRSQMFTGDVRSPSERRQGLVRRSQGLSGDVRGCQRRQRVEGLTGDVKGLLGEVRACQETSWPVRRPVRRRQGPKEALQSQKT